MYSSTATWHQQTIAHQTFTKDTCNKCWGSGNSGMPGLNLLEVELVAKAVYRRRYREDFTFRWKERTRRFARRARNIRLNYNELSRELQQAHKERNALEQNSVRYAAKIDSLFDAMKHCDEKHCAWLKEAIEKHFHQN